MSPQAELEALAQSVYRAIKNRAYDDLTTDDGKAYLDNIADFANQYLDELEYTIDENGEPVDFWFLRQNGYTLGTATSGASSITKPNAVDKLLADELRYVQILQDGTAVSNWAVVEPGDMGNGMYRTTENMCALVGTSIVFSRPFTDGEAAGTIVGDVTLSVPRLTITNGKATNVKAVSIVKPRELLVLGIAKNATLPDIVQGKLSPSYVQRYQQLLAGAIARSKVSSRSQLVSRQQFGYVRGDY